jgi:hypothetical protein
MLLQSLIEFDLARAAETVHPAWHMQVIEWEFHDVLATAETTGFFDAYEARIDANSSEFSFCVRH